MTAQVTVRVAGILHAAEFWSSSLVKKIVMTMTCLYQNKNSSSACGRATGFVILFFLNSGPWSHKWHFEAPTSHQDLALFDLGWRPQKARNLQTRHCIRERLSRLPIRNLGTL